MRYALLIAPSTNRVYADASLRLTRSELAIFGGSVLSSQPVEVEELTLGGVRYIGFTAELSERDIVYLSNLSSQYALFGLADGGVLRPVTLRPLAHFDDDLITIPKYAGKTNEQFTRLLLNVTLLASRAASAMLDHPLVVLDPLCGRGTTLNQALMYGYDGVGIERNPTHVDAYSAFLRTYLQRKKVKHHSTTSPVRRDRRLVARRFEVELGSGRRVTVFQADTINARELLRPGCADVAVADLPYGVAHGSRADGALSRAPLELLRAAVPVWVQLLRHGGALGLAFNTHVASRDRVADVLVGCGLSVVDGPGYEQLAHRVDQAILRDVIVARRS